jgi:hypothetical protein
MFLRRRDNVSAPLKRRTARQMDRLSGSRLRSRAAVYLTLGFSAGMLGCQAHGG